MDSTRIGIFGASVGGYLSLMTAATNGEADFDVGENLDYSSDVQAAVSLYGISNLLTIGEGFNPELIKVHASPAVTEALIINGAAFNTFLGALILAPPPGKTAAASPISHVDGSEPPTLLLHGAQELLVSPLQSAKMFDALQKVGVDVKYIFRAWRSAVVSGCCLLSLRS